MRLAVGCSESKKTAPIGATTAPIVRLGPPGQSGTPEPDATIASRWQKTLRLIKKEAQPDGGDGLGFRTLNRARAFAGNREVRANGVKTHARREGFSALP